MVQLFSCFFLLYSTLLDRNFVSPYLHFDFSLKFTSYFPSNVFFVLCPYYWTRFLLVYHWLERYNLLRLKPNWMQFIEENELIPYILMADSSVTSVYACFWFLHSKNYQKKVLDLFPILLSVTKWNNWYLFYVGCWYSTMNTTMFYHFFPIMIGYVRNLLYCYIMTILLTLVITSSLII